MWTTGQSEPSVTLQAGRYAVRAETRDKRYDRPSTCARARPRARADRRLSGGPADVPAGCRAGRHDFAGLVDELPQQAWVLDVSELPSMTGSRIHLLMMAACCAAGLVMSPAAAQQQPGGWQAETRAPARSCQAFSKAGSKAGNKAPSRLRRGPLASADAAGLPPNTTVVPRSAHRAQGSAGASARCRSSPCSPRTARTSSRA